MQGPRPSFTQIILPQLRQLGAAVRSGWRVARQVQRRVEGEVDRVGLVCSSRDWIAESKSERVVEAPCMAGPPVRVIFVLFCGAGDAVRGVFVRTLGRSEIRGPEAEGGGLEGVGRWTASGSKERIEVFTRGVSLRGRIVADI